MHIPCLLSLTFAISSGHRTSSTTCGHQRTRAPTPATMSRPIRPKTGSFCLISCKSKTRTLVLICILAPPLARMMQCGTGQGRAGLILWVLMAKCYVIAVRAFLLFSMHADTRSNANVARTTAMPVQEGWWADCARGILTYAVLSTSVNGSLIYAELSSSVDGSLTHTVLSISVNLCQTILDMTWSCRSV